MKKMGILIFGGAGYLGSMLSKRFLEQYNKKITIVDNLRYNQGYYTSDVLMNKNVTFINCDVMDTPKEVIEKSNLIYDLAALVGPICDKYPEEAQKTNVEFTKWLVPQIKDHQKLIYLCSSSGYGEANTTCTEETPMSSISLYAKTKEESEKIIMDSGINAVSLRLATVWGRSLYHRLDLLVNDLTWQAVKTSKLELYQGDYKRAYVHIDDVVDLLVGCNFNPRLKGIYNVAGDNFSKTELVAKIQQLIPNLEVTFSKQVDKDKRSYFLDCSKIGKAGHYFHRTLDTDLQDLINFYKIVDDNQTNLNRMRYDEINVLQKRDETQEKITESTYVDTSL